MNIIQLNKTIDIWIEALSKYSLETLQQKKLQDSWTLGQVYMHILSDTYYYIGQIECCLNNNENRSEQMTAFAITLFSKGEFPDQRIKGNASDSETMAQPDNKENLLTQITDLKNQLNLICTRVIKSNSFGKTKHPGLGYFNAKEWFEFSEIHMRHHLRQKERLDAAFETNPLTNL